VTATIPDVIDRTACEQLDRVDPLARFRERFVLDDASITYMDGNSLGALPKDTPRRLAHVVEQEWGRGLVRSWTDAGWMELPVRVGGKIAQLVGGHSDEVLVVDTTSVDLFKLIAAALKARPERRVVLTERENFPTDRYVPAGVAALLGDREVRIVEREQIRNSLDESVALLALTHVDFGTGEVHDMARLTEAAHAAGALALWDLCHSAAAIPVDLNGAGVDLAAGCGYKYLNGGPGAPGYLYVARRLQGELRNPIQGWLGHENPFGLEQEFRPAPGIRSWISSSPSIIGLAALEVGVDLALEADMGLVSEKARTLTELFIRLADVRLAGYGFDLASPRDSALRGAQVSLRHPRGYGVVKALIDRGVIPDFREPDICRFGMPPLYTRHVDVWKAIDHIVGVMETRAYANPDYAVRAFIT
jgi:kynureninase